MNRDFSQQSIDEFLLDDLEQLVRLAVREELARGFDLTTIAIVPQAMRARADIVSRQPGVAAGLELLPHIVEMTGAPLEVDLHYRDAASFAADTRLATLHGEARDLLTCERTLLNILGRLCGVATGTREYVERIAGLPVRLYDTRKTTPGWRRLEKYAVRCGGAHNHRLGLFDAVLIKDNHLACHASATGSALRPSEAVRRARQFLKEQPRVPAGAVVEIEVDTLEQLADALDANPDIVLLDNMSTQHLQQAVALRDDKNRAVELEASGGVRLETVRAIAHTGVDRISVGALTHSAVNLDLGLDWTLL